MREATKAWAGIALMRIMVLIVVIPSALAGPVEEWNSILGGVPHDLGGSVRFTSDGGFLITDLTYSYGAGGNLSQVKADSNCTEQWNRAHGGKGAEDATSV